MSGRKVLAAVKGGDMGALESALRDILQTNFSNVEIVEVRVDDSEFSDEDVLAIEVVFKGSPKDLDAKQLAGSIRSVRPTLRARGFESFPLMSFITSKEATGRKLAPA